MQSYNFIDYINPRDMNLILWLPLNLNCLRILVVQLEFHFREFHCHNETYENNYVEFIHLVLLRQRLFIAYEKHNRHKVKSHTTDKYDLLIFISHIDGSKRRN